MTYSTSLNSKAAVVASGGQTVLSTLQASANTLPRTEDSTIFIVFNIIQTNRLLFSYGTTNDTTRWFFTNNNRSFASNVRVASEAIFIDKACSLLNRNLMSVVQPNTGLQRGWQNGEAFTTTGKNASWYNPTGGTARLFSAEAGASSLNCVGGISELIIAKTALSDVDRQAVEGYLAWKWGTTLPTNHPWYFAAPNIKIS